MYYDTSLVQYSRESRFILEIKSYLNFNPGHTQGENKQTKKYQQKKKPKLCSICALDDTTEFKSSVVTNVSHLGNVFEMTNCTKFEKIISY